jgi:hypothetical protein
VPAFGARDVQAFMQSLGGVDEAGHPLDLARYTACLPAAAPSRAPSEV